MSTNQKGSRTTDAQLITGFHSAPVVPCATGTAVPSEKVVGEGNFMECQKQFFFSTDYLCDDGVMLCQANLIQFSI